MSRNLTRAAVLVVLVSSVASGYVSFAPTAHAAAVSGGGSGVQQSWQHTSVERIQLPASVCAARKAANPTQANNPDLCIIIHTARWNDFTPTGRVAAGMVSISPDLIIGGGGCAQGQQPFDDNYTDPLSSNMEFQLTFQWNNNCAAPTVVFKNCWYNWLIGIFISESCTTGNPTSSSTQVFHLIHFHPGGVLLIDAGIWQRRTCYSDAHCGYHTDLG